MMYYVVGGEYTDTDFSTLVAGTEERHGPLPEVEANELWKGLSMRHIDACLRRYMLEPEV